LPLKETQRPLVSVDGTGFIPTENDLYVLDKPVEIYEGSKSFFVDEWGESPEKASELASFLEKAVGTTPSVLMEGQAGLLPNIGVANYVVNTVNGNKIEANDRITLVTFMRVRNLNGLGEYFAQVKWVEFNLTFTTTNIITQ
jgi:hypothetical protein